MITSMDKISVLFWLNTSKENDKGESPIYLRVTHNKKRSELSTGRKTDKKNWDPAGQRILGDSESADTINTYIETTRVKIRRIHTDLMLSGEPMTSALITERLSNKPIESHTLSQAFQQHNDRMLSLVGKDIQQCTHDRYLVTYRKFLDFVGQNACYKDVQLNRLTPKFISDFEHYLKVNDGIGQNTTTKHLKILKKVINFAVTNQLTISNPFSAHRCKTTPTARGYLTMAELKVIEDKDFSTDRLNTVRDIFVFCCYTGLSYCDVQKLSLSHILHDESGEDWIVIKRTKNGNESIIPILPKAKEILDQYKNHPESKYKGRLLPARSNQKMNEYLHEIGTVCGLEKRITCHLARHTFATTITLANGVSTETVSKMLGHTNIRTTQIYAKMTMGRIGYEMEQIKDKL